MANQDNGKNDKGKLDYSIIPMWTVPQPPSGLFLGYHKEGEDFLRAVFNEDWQKATRILFDLLGRKVAINYIQAALQKGLDSGRGRHTWKSVPNGYERFRAALSRHIIKCAEEGLDTESGLPHVSHILTNLVFLSYLSEEQPDASTEVPHADLYHNGL